VPAAAVIPAPVAYIKVVAVKKLVVEFRDVHLASPVRASTVMGNPQKGLLQLYTWLESWGGEFNRSGSCREVGTSSTSFCG